MITVSIIALIVIVTIGIIAISVIRSGRPDNNFTIEKFNGQAYYVMYDSYDGDYDVQYADLHPEIDGVSNNVKMLSSWMITIRLV